MDDRLKNENTVLKNQRLSLGLTSQRWLLWLFFLALFFLLFSVLWGKIAIYASAEGKIIPDNYSKTVQAQINGIVQSILVKNGDKVKQGQALIALDASQTAADLNTLRQQIWLKNNQMIRAKHLLQQMDYPQLSLIPRSVERGTFSADSSLTQIQIAVYRAKKASLETDIQLKQSRLMTENLALKGLLKQEKVLAQQYGDYQALYGQSVASSHEVLTMEKNYWDIRTQRETKENSIKSLRLEIQLSADKLAEYRLEIRQTLAERIEALNGEIGGLNQSLLKKQAEERSLVLRSPLPGIVEGLAIHTQGASVVAGQAMLSIVPSDPILTAELYLPNKDRGWIQEGDPVFLRIDSYPFTRYGLLRGSISHVAEDAVEDKTRGWIYLVAVDINQSALTKMKVHLQPGMSLVGDIQVGERRLIEYFIHPFQLYRQTSLHEL